MAPLSAGTGRRAIRGFGLKLQQSTVAWLQAKLSASTHVHLPHLPLNTLLLPPLLSCLSRKVCEESQSWLDGYSRWCKNLEVDLSAPVFVRQSPYFVKSLSRGFHLFPSSFNLVQCLRLSYSLMSGSVSGFSRLCLIHCCWSWLAGRWSLLVADTETSWEVEREVTQVMVSKFLLCHHVVIF